MAHDAPHEISISGAWMLDLSRSETFEGYLRNLGSSESAIEAQVAAERVYPSRNVIALDSSSLIIHKDTAVNSYTENFKLDEERVIPRPDGGARHATASLGNEDRLDGYVVVSNTIAPCGRFSLETVEARQLLEGGLAHIQQLHVRRTDNGRESATTRTWVRVPLTPEDRMRLLS